MKIPEGSPISRPLIVAEIGEKGTRDRIEATRAERAAIVDLLALEALDALSFDYSIVPTGNNRFVLEGTIGARVTQACVITLDPVETSPSLPVKAVFWPEADIQTEAGHDDVVEVDPDDETPEPIIDGQIDPGQFAYEHFAASLDPYPRRSNASFSWSDSRAEDGMDGPFAALKSLKMEN